MKASKARGRAHALVRQTGNAYAYEFVKVPLLGLVEVRAFNGGRTMYTRVDASGRPIGRAHGGLPSLKRLNSATAISVGVAASSLAFALVELLH